MEIRICKEFDHLPYGRNWCECKTTCKKSGNAVAIKAKHFPIVQEAAKIASKQMEFYRSMMPKPKPLNYWPYCEVCHQPFWFDPNEPFAYCDCGTTEWGDPRPADYVDDPNELKAMLLTKLNIPGHY